MKPVKSGFGKEFHFIGEENLYGKTCLTEPQINLNLSKQDIFLKFHHVSFWTWINQTLVQMKQILNSKSGSV